MENVDVVVGTSAPWFILKFGLFLLLLIVVTYGVIVVYQLIADDAYDVMGPFYDMLMAPFERKHLDPMRRKYVPRGVSGRTLDVCAGTGHNIKYYPEGSSVTLLDASTEMLARAEVKGAMRFSECRLDFVTGKLEALPFSDGEFSSVISFDVFCSVSDPSKALREIARVVVSGGTVTMVEHFRTYNVLTDILLAIQTALIYPLLRSSMIRETDRLIERAGDAFEIVEFKRLTSTFRYFRLRRR